MRNSSAVNVRRFEPRDREAVLRLAERLQEGVAGWRDADAVHDAVRGWVRDAVDATGENHAGELVVAANAERRGIGRALITAAEQWAEERGLAHVTLDTGAANIGARSFYAALGYLEEDVKLTKRLK